MSSIMAVPGPKQSNIRMRKETLGGCTYDLGCYNTSMIGWMTGLEPDEVNAVSVFSPEGVDVLTSAIFTYKNGIKASMNCGMVLETNANQRIDQLRIEGSAGSIRSTAEFNGCGNLTYTIIRNEKCEEKTVFTPHNYRLEVEQFGRCILNGETPHVSRDFTTGNLKVLERILKAVGY